MGYSQIKGISIEIGGDTTKLSKALSSINKDLRSTQSDLKAVDKALKLDPTNVNLLNEKHKLLGQSIAQTNEKLNTLKTAYQQGLSNHDIGQDEMEALQREITLTESALGNLQSEYDSFGDSAEDATQAAVDATEDLTNNLDKAGEKLQAVGDKISSVGSTLTKTVTAPIVGVGTASIKTAADFETSMSKLATIADTDSVSIEELQESILALSGEIGISVNDLAEDMYNAISAGQETADAINFVSKSSKLAAAGFAESGDALDILTTILNAYGLEASEVSKVSDTLIATQNMGKTTVAELSQAMGKVIPTAKAANTDLTQVSTAFAKLTANGINTAEAGTKLNAMLNELSKSGTAVDGVFKDKLGKSFAEFMAEGNSLTDALALVQEAADEAGVSFGDMFNSSEAKSAAQVLSDTTNKLGDFNQAASQIGSAAGATDTAFATVSDTANNQLNKALNDLKNLSIEVGQDLLPLFVEALTALRDVTKDVSTWFGGLSDDQKDLAIKLAATAAAAGPVLSVFGKMTSGIGSLVQMGGKFSSWAGSLGSAGSTISSVGSAASGAAQGIGSAGSAMGGLAQNATGFVAVGAGIALAAGGMWLLADAAVKIAQEGWGAAGVLLEMTALIAGLAFVFAGLGPALTAGSEGILIFGIAMLAVGAGIGIATAGMALLCEQFPLVAEYGEPAADAFVALGASILAMSVECLAATPNLLAVDAALLALAVSTAASDLAWVAFGATMALAAAGVGVLDLAMLGFAATMDSIEESAVKAGESIGFIQENVDVIKSGVNGLADAVGSGLSAVVDWFTDTSTEPVEEWTAAFNDIISVATDKMAQLQQLIVGTLLAIKMLFSNTKLAFNHDIELPHFSLNGAFDAQTGRVPEVNVNWYKTGGIFNSPSVIGVGEAGAEAVVPVDKLQTMIDASTKQNNTEMLGVLNSMLTVLQTYLPKQGQQVVLDSGQLVGAIAPKMDNALGTISNRRSRQG